MTANQNLIISLLFQRDRVKENLNDNLWIARSSSSQMSRGIATRAAERQQKIFDQLTDRICELKGL